MRRLVIAIVAMLAVGGAAANAAERQSGAVGCCDDCYYGYDQNQKEFVCEFESGWQPDPEGSPNYWYCRYHECGCEDPGCNPPVNPLDDCDAGIGGGG